MESSFELCPGCNARLYDAVRYCPFCGVGHSVADMPPTGLAAGASVVAASPAAPIKVPAHAPVAAPPVPAPTAAMVTPREQLAPAKTTATAPAAAQAEPPAESPAVPPKTQELPAKPPRSKTGIVVTLGLVVLVGTYLIGKPSKKEEPCDQALTKAATQLAGGDAMGARGQTVLALAACNGEARAKASELQAAVDRAVAAQANCERSFRRITSLIAEHRLQSARGARDQLDTGCADSLQGKGLLAQIETGQAAAAAAEAEMRKQLADGNLKAARAAFNQVGANNREHPDLAALRQELAAGVKAPDSAPPMNPPVVTASAVTAPSVGQRDGQREPPQTARSQSTPPTVNSSGAASIPIPKDATLSLEDTNRPSNQSSPRSASMRSNMASLLLSLETAFPHVQAMVSASLSGNTEKVELEASTLTSLVPRPARGDRRVARKLNEEALRVMGDSAVRASELLYQANTADPADIEIIGNLAYALYLAKDYSEAYVVSRVSVAISPRRTSSWSTLALATLKDRFDILGEQADIPLTSIGAFQNAYRYSTNPEKTIEYLTTLANSDPDPAVRALALRVLPTLATVKRVAESNSQISSTVEYAASKMRPGVVFKDCADCPEMVVLPGAGGGAPTMAMGQAEVTQGQWQAVMGNNPSYFKQCGSDCPVEKVSYVDAQEFIQKLSAKTGKTYRLPTGQEWDYGCLGGRQTVYCGGNSVDAVAWYDKNSGATTHRVRTKQVNGFGLYDMSGNVWEWVDSCTIHAGFKDCWQHALRGGSWDYVAADPRTGSRGMVNSRSSSDDFGFRLVRILP